MVVKTSIRLLIVGFGKSEVTFINRLITGLAGKGVHITIASAQRPAFQNIQSENIDWLWAPAWQDAPFLRVFRVLWLLIKGLPFQRLPWLIGLVRKEKTHFIKFLTLYRYLPFVRGQWDVIYFPWNSAAIDYLALFDLGVPIVLSCRGSQVNITPFLSGQQRFAELLKTTFEKAAAVHCVSQDIVSTAVALGLDPKKAVVIHPAVDTFIFSPGSDPYNNHPIRLVTTGSLIWRKGFEYLLVALRKLKDQGINSELHVMGDGPERNRILFTAQDLDISSQVILHGRLSTKEVVSQLQQADTFVLSSLSEGVSNAVLEAMSCGLPVVITDCGGMREAVHDGVEGFIVPLRDPESMEEALHKCALDPDLRKRMGKAGRERVFADFNSQSQIEAFIRLLKGVRVNEAN